MDIPVQRERDFIIVVRSLLMQSSKKKRDATAVLVINKCVVCMSCLCKSESVILPYNATYSLMRHIFK
jgi:hypothetical protein